MTVTVAIPSMLQRHGQHTVTLHGAFSTIADVVRSLETAVPGISRELEDSVFNFAINDEMLLHRVEQHPIHDGDRIEIVPAISGG